MIPSQYGIAVVTRFLYPLEQTDLQLEALGWPGKDAEFLTRWYSGSRDGLWLVAGPTGSGKSTTLRALLQLSIQANEKVLSVEDPVEFPMKGAHQLSVGVPPGLTWGRAIRAFLRQAPDTVLVGEIRDEETASIALQAARTGHRILSTLHARDDQGVMRRLIDLGQQTDCLRGTCECILHQRLLPGLCRHCRSEVTLSKEAREAIHHSGLIVPESVARENSCARCHSGTKGRVPIFTYNHPDAPSDTAAGLGRAAWDAVIRHEASLRFAVPYLAEPLRTRFGICQR